MHLKSLECKILLLVLTSISGLYACSSFGSQELFPFGYYYSKSVQAAKITVMESTTILVDEDPPGRQCGSVLTYTVDKVFSGVQSGGKVFIKDSVPAGKYYVLIYEAKDYEDFKDILSEEDVRSLFCYIKITSKYIDIHPRLLYPIVNGEYVFVEERNPLLSEIDKDHKVNLMMWRGIKGFKVPMEVIENIFKQSDQ